MNGDQSPVITDNHHSSIYIFEKILEQVIFSNIYSIYGWKYEYRNKFQHSYSSQNSLHTILINQDKNYITLYMICLSFYVYGRQNGAVAEKQATKKKGSSSLRDRIQNQNMLVFRNN